LQPGIIAAEKLPLEGTATPPQPDRLEQFALSLAGCQRSLFLYALGLLHNTADVEDVLQEANLVLWRKFDEYAPGTDFGKWARRVVYYEVLKFLEKKPRAERLFSNDFIEGLAEAAARGAGLLARRREALAGCLGKLSESDRRLVSLRYREHGKTAAVAGALGRSAQAVRKSIHRIRTALLGCIERTLAAEERT
jgi:RNA polymerase sigma-70 factor, ECF subfamily